MLAARDYYQTTGDQDMESARKFLKDVEKAKYDMAMINHKIDLHFSIAPEDKKQDLD